MQTDDVDETVVENDAGNNEYVITVRATEMQDEDEDSNALSSAKAIIVEVTDVQEDRHGDHQLAPAGGDDRNRGVV